MSGTTRIDLPGPGAGPLLPRELPFLYPLVPFAAALLLIDGFLEMPPALQVTKLASTVIPLAAMTLTLHPLYAWVMPRLLALTTARWQAALLHVGVLVAVPAGVARLVLPLHNEVCGKELPANHFMVMCVIISMIIIFPAMLVQAQRTRAQAIERLAMAERQANLRAQLEALQARTNPHFFFNSINTVASLITDDPVLAERTLERLADLFRYALDSNKTPTVPLSREFEMVTDYLAIQRARFGARLSTHVTLDPKVASFAVPPLLLQPLVENAILHGLSNRKSGRVDVIARGEAGRVIIEVRDDGPGPGASTHQGTQTSMKDLAVRLRLAFGEQSFFALEPAPGGGCLARLALPVPSAAA